MEEKEQELVKRIEKLSKRGLRACLFSFRDVVKLEELVSIGEDFDKIKV